MAWRGLCRRLPSLDLTEPEPEDDGGVAGQVFPAVDRATVLHQLEQPAAHHEVVNYRDADAVGVHMGVVHLSALRKGGCGPAAWL